jgi:hypothetical protein
MQKSECKSLTRSLYITDHLRDNVTILPVKNKNTNRYITALKQIRKNMEKAFDKNRVTAAGRDYNKWELPLDYNIDLKEFTQEELPQLRDKLKAHFQFYSDTANLKGIKKDGIHYNYLVGQMKAIEKVGVAIKTQLSK